MSRLPEKTTSPPSLIVPSPLPDEVLQLLETLLTLPIQVSMKAPLYIEAPDLDSELTPGTGRQAVAASSALYIEALTIPATSPF